eukprot:PLAT5423.1.p1 GENE.PLAT5423.1~~PLAT5423.1.p1  ORF type:complete len:482 (-),score=99.03 PLAT5423.1:116-1561(-)
MAAVTPDSVSDAEPATRTGGYSPLVVSDFARTAITPKTLAAMVFLPLPLTLLGMVPYFIPWNLADGPTVSFLAINFTAMFYPAVTVPVIFYCFAGVSLPVSRVLVLWFVGGSVNAAIACAGTPYGIFPIPFAPILSGGPSFLTQLSLAFFFLPAEARKAKQTQLLRAVALLGFFLAMTTMWMVFRALFITFSGLAQAASILMLPVIRFGALMGSEWLTSGEVDQSGSMAAPITFSVEMYNALFNASLFSSVSSPVNAALIVLADMAGTFFYFGLMLGVGPKLRRFAQACCTCSCARNGDVVSVYVADTLDSDGADEEEAAEVDYRNWRAMALKLDGSPASTMRSRAGNQFRSKLRISAFLLIEEYVELHVPLIMAIVLLFAKYGWNPGIFPQYSGMPIDDFNVTLQYLGLSFVSEAVLFCATGWIIHRQFRINLITHLAYIMKRYWWLLLAQAQLVVMFTFALVSSYTGIDFTFKFAWIKR